MPNHQCLTKETSAVLMGLISIIIGLVAVPTWPPVTCPLRMTRKYVGTDLPSHGALDFTLAAFLNGMNILGVLD